MHKILALLPCYNEEKNLEALFKELKKIDFEKIIIINDGSTDNSLQILKNIKKKQSNLIILNLKKNLGLSKAKISGFAYLFDLAEKNIISPSDYVLKIDSDGQHNVEDIQRLIKFIYNKNFDFVQTSRDLSKYPKYKKMGNLFFKILIKIFSFKNIDDPMSGMKIIRIGCIKKILQYFQGMQYSASQEISLILSKQKRTCFDFKISINKYIEGAKFLNGFKVVLGMIICFLRIIFKFKFNPEVRTTKLLKNIEIL